jgi:prepilin-type N-terminal cleavage/methylation domain-containing protein
MTSAPARAGDRGFTLLEVLVTLALIALLTSVLIVGSTRILNGQAATPEDVLFKAVSDTRKFAVETNSDVRLSFDPKGRAFTASNDQASRSYPLKLAGDVGFDFLSSQKGGSAMLIGGVLVETQPMSYVTFYPDGTCSPFRVQVRTEGAANVIGIDPWTCAPMLQSEQK